MTDKNALGVVGFPTFLADGASAFGAVRAERHGELMINVEGAGDFMVPLTAVMKVVSKKVVLDARQLPDEVLQAVVHATDREEFPPRDEGEVELVSEDGTPLEDLEAEMDRDLARGFETR